MTDPLDPLAIWWCTRCIAAHGPHRCADPAGGCECPACDDLDDYARGGPDAPAEPA